MGRFDLDTKVKITLKNFMQWFGQSYRSPLLIMLFYGIIHAVSSYKKRSYKKRLVDFIKNKKRQLVDIQTAKKQVS